MSLSAFPWQLLVVSGSILTSIGQIFNKHQVHKAASLQVSTYKYLSGSILITSVWLATNGMLPKSWWIFVLYGMSAGFIVTLYTKASRYSLSKSALMSPVTQIIGIGIAAVVLNEWRVFDLSTSGGVQMALGLSLVPVLMWLFYEKTIEAKQWSTLMWIVIICLSIMRVLQKYFLNTIAPVQLLMFQYWGSLTINLLGLKWRNHKFFIGKRFAVTGLIQGLLTSTAILLYFTGLKKATLSQAGLLRLPVIMTLTILFGLFIFQEFKSMTRKKWLGIGVALVMAVLVVTANH